MEDIKLSSTYLLTYLLCCDWTIHPTAKVSKEVNRKCRARYTTTFNSLHRPWVPQWTTLQTDRRADRRQYDANNRPYDGLKSSLPSNYSSAGYHDNEHQHQQQWQRWWESVRDVQRQYDSTRDMMAGPWRWRTSCPVLWFMNLLASDMMLMSS